MDHSTIDRAVAKIAELIMHMRYHVNLAPNSLHGDSSSPRENSEFGISLKNSYDILTKINRFRQEKRNAGLLLSINFFMERKEEADTCVVEKWTITAEGIEECVQEGSEEELKFGRRLSSLFRSTAVSLVNLPLWNEFLLKKHNRDSGNFYLDHEIHVENLNEKMTSQKPEHKHYESFIIPSVCVEGYGQIHVKLDYLINLELMSENRSANSNITFVLSEDGRSETGRFNLRSNMRERFFSDEISDNGNLEKKKKRTNSVFLDPREPPAHMFKSFEKPEVSKVEKPEIIKIKENNEDEENLAFKKQYSKESECEFLIVEDDTRCDPETINENSLAILRQIRKLKDSYKCEGNGKKAHSCSIKALLSNLNKSLS